METRRSITLPDLGVECGRVRLSMWLVPVGTRLKAGERVVEILTGDAVVDLPALADGVLAEKCVAEDTLLTATGQVLGWIDVEMD